MFLSNKRVQGKDALFRRRTGRERNLGVGIMVLRLNYKKYQEGGKVYLTKGESS